VRGVNHQIKFNRINKYIMFNNSKYTKYYFKIIKESLQNPPTGYSEKHHIIPRSLGGDDSISNVVKLTARAHFICHKLLVLMTSGQAKYKMLEAVSIFQIIRIGS
jgi:5-methylcytosine-specific restriction endonuclease McrA